MIKFEFVGLEVSNYQCINLESILSKEFIDFADTHVHYECTIDVLSFDTLTFDLIATFRDGDYEFTPRLISIFRDTPMMNITLSAMDRLEKHFRHRLLEKGLI